MPNYKKGKKHPRYRHGASRKEDPEHWLYQRWGQPRRKAMRCPAWNDYPVFRAYVATLPGFKDVQRLGLVLDRIDGRRGYEPGNVRWVTKAENARNRVDSAVVDGKTLPAHANGDRTALARMNERRRSGKRNDDILKTELGGSQREAIHERNLLLRWCARENCFLIDEDGRVVDSKNKKPLIPHSDGSDGYLRIKMPAHILRAYESDGGKKLTSAAPFPVHRLLAVVWLGLPRDPAWQVDHINGNRADNRRCNLRWTPPVANAANKHPPDSRSSPRVDYSDLAGYADLVGQSLSTSMPEGPNSADFVQARRLFEKHQEEAACSPLATNTDLIMNILAAPSNEVQETQDGVTILVMSNQGKLKQRTILARGSVQNDARETDKVFLACPVCGYEASTKRFEIREKRESNGPRYRETHCKVCASLGKVAPLLADLVIPDQLTGEVVNPLAIAARTGGRSLWFRCSREGCEQLAGARVVKKQVLRHCESGVLPTCEPHRERRANLSK